MLENGQVFFFLGKKTFSVLRFHAYEVLRSACNTARKCYEGVVTCLDVYASQIGNRIRVARLYHSNDSTSVHTQGGWRNTVLVSVYDDSQTPIFSRLCFILRMFDVQIFAVQSLTLIQCLHGLQ